MYTSSLPLKGVLEHKYLQLLLHSPQPYDTRKRRTKEMVPTNAYLIYVSILLARMPGICGIYTAMDVGVVGHVASDAWLTHSADAIMLHMTNTSHRTWHLSWELLQYRG